MRDVRCKASIETVRAGAGVGNYRAELVFELTQALALYDFYPNCASDECDAEIGARAG